MPLVADDLYNAIYPPIKEDIYQPLYDAFYAITGYMIEPGNFWKVQGTQAAPDPAYYQAAIDEASRRATEIATVLSDALADKISRTIADQIRPWIVQGSEITCTIPATSIGTVGGSNAQSGPQSNLEIAGIVDEGP